jgi:hypothetical protein
MINKVLKEKLLAEIGPEKVDINSVRMFIDALRACPQVVGTAIPADEFAEFVILGAKVISLYTYPEQYLQEPQY